jgi:hypothetical protein
MCSLTLESPCAGEQERGWGGSVDEGVVSAYGQLRLRWVSQWDATTRGRVAAEARALQGRPPLHRCAAWCLLIMIRTEDYMKRNVGESQPLIRFLSQDTQKLVGCAAWRCILEKGVTKTQRGGWSAGIRPARQTAGGPGAGR